MSKTTTGAVEAYSNDDNRFGIKLDGEWYNGFGDLPEKFQEKGVVVEITYETNKNNGKTYRNVDDAEDDIELVDEQEEQTEGDHQAPVEESQENMGRQKPIEAVGRIYQGNPPTSAQELNEMKVLLKELTNWSNNGEFAVDAQPFETDKEEIMQSINELSERIGQVEQKLASDSSDEPPVKDMSEVKEFIEDELQRLKDEEDMDVIFGEDDDEPEDADMDEFVDDGDREESKVDSDDEEDEKDDE